MHPLVAEFLAYSANIRGEPPNTIAARRRVLTTAPHPDQPRETFEAWWATRADRAPSTRQADLAHLRKFFRWLDVWEHRDVDRAWPIARLEAPSVHKGLPRPLTTTDLRKLEEAMPADLMRAVHLGVGAGLRVSETAALMWADVDTEQYQLRIDASKGGKSRLIPIDFTLLDILGENTGGNVVTGTAHVYTSGGLQRRLNRAMQAAGVEATSHQLRHRYGTLAYRASNDLLAVGRLMGHSNTATTAVYAEPSSDVARKIAAAVVRDWQR